MDFVNATFDTVIYVGSGHSEKAACADPGKIEYESVIVELFSQKQGIIGLKARRCCVCGSIFLPCAKYEKHCFSIRNYRFIRSTTGKPPYQEDIKAGKFKSDPNYVPEKLDYDDYYKTPTYIKNNLQHPYQGGRTSPR